MADQTKGDGAMSLNPLLSKLGAGLRAKVEAKVG